MRAEGQSRALFVERKRLFVKRESGSVAAVFVAAQPCGLHSVLHTNSLSKSRRRSAG
jgi:hypothetical protein